METPTAIRTSLNETNQKAFSQIVTHLRKQRKPSETEDGCTYHNENGTKCAVGCLITPEAYNPNIEFTSVKGPLVSKALELSGWGGNLSDQLLIEMQSIHDDVPPNKWEESYREVAATFGLELPK